MNEEIKKYMGELKKHLTGLPEDEIQRAIDYYEEYLNDSLDAGGDLGEVLKELGPSERLAESIKIEANYLRAKKNPDIRNFSRVIGDAFKGVTAPISIFSLSITVLLSFCMLALIFGGAVVSGIGAAAVILLCIYQAFTIPFKFLLEIAGTIGFGLLGSGILALTALYFWQGGRLFIRLSTKQIGLMLKLSGKTVSEPVKKEGKGLWPITRIILLATAAGFIIFSVSGIPWRYFTIFNSMKPEGRINRAVEEFKASDIRKINVLTAHSSIRIEEGSSDKIVISYEEPDWLDYELSSNGGELNFREVSSGRLPFFSLVSLHESKTELSITLPRGYKADSIMLRSVGGNIYIQGKIENLEVKTTTGKVQ